MRSAVTNGPLRRDSRCRMDGVTTHHFEMVMNIKFRWGEILAQRRDSHIFEWYKHNLYAIIFEFIIGRHIHLSQGKLCRSLLQS